jgi:hypothetical protein
MSQATQHQWINRALLGLAGLALVVDLVAGLVVSRSVGDVVTLSIPVAFLAVGWLIVRRYPQQVEGRLLLVIGLAWAVILALPFDGGWVVPVGLMGTHLLLRYPDGELPSPRWVWFSNCCTLMIVILAVMVTTASQVTSQGQLNPYFVPWTQVLSFLIVTFPLCLVVSVVSVVVRYRRASALARTQIRWLAAAAAVIVGLYTTTLATSLVYDARHHFDGTKANWFAPQYPFWLVALQITALLSFLLIPAAFGIAILRYRLYDIDRIISRTTSYLIVTGAVVGLFALIVLASGRLLGPNTSSLTVAAATLIAAAVFQPLLRRIQSAVDRRFNRSRYNAAHIVEQFGAQLRHEVDTDNITTSLLRAVTDTLQPSLVSLTLGPRS